MAEPWTWTTNPKWPLKEPDSKREAREALRPFMAYAHWSDFQMANAVRMLMRNDLDHEAVVTGARDRIRFLSQQLDEALEALKPFAKIGEQVRRSRGDADPLFGYDGVEITAGEARRAAAAVKAAGGV